MRTLDDIIFSHESESDGFQSYYDYSNVVKIAKEYANQENETLIAQRKELLEALKLYMKRNENGWMINLAWRQDTHDVMKKAIENAENQTP